MIKSELIERLYKKQPYLNQHDIELAVNCIVNKMSDALSAGERIEIRGFGSFSVKTRVEKIGRNPRIGESVIISKRRVVRFKAGLDLAQRVKDSIK